MVEKLPKGKNADEPAKVAVRMLMPFIGSILSITTNNGSEFARHKTIAKRFKTTVYFAYPYAAWEKGAIENFNKLLRQYIPKMADFNDFNEQDIMTFQKEIDERPKHST